MSNQIGVGCLQPQICKPSTRKETFVSLSASQTNGLVAALVAEPAALTNGYRLSFAIGASLVLVALVIAGMVLRPAEEAEKESLHERDQPLGDAAFPPARVR